MHSSKQWALGVMEAGVKAGMKIDLFFFLTNFDANGGNQSAPPAWRSYNVSQMAKALYQHTYSTTKYYLDKGLKIGLYEVGNEIDSGCCGYTWLSTLRQPGTDVIHDYSWDESHVWKYEAALLNSSIAGIKAADPSAKIALHISLTQYPQFIHAWFQYMNSLHVPYDYGELSAYPWLNDNPYPGEPDFDTYLGQSVAAIADAGKPTMIAEYSFPSSTPPSSVSWVSVPGYDFTEQGQSAWIKHFLTLAECNSAIDGVFYFYPDVSWDYLGSAALFRDQTSLKPAVSDFDNVSALASGPCPALTTTTSTTGSTSATTTSTSTTGSTSATTTSTSTSSTTSTSSRTSTSTTSTSGAGTSGVASSLTSTTATAPTDTSTTALAATLFVSAILAASVGILKRRGATKAR
jgi:arabinogalactan endo-1,4-beta-galactosidase